MMVMVVVMMVPMMSVTISWLVAVTDARQTEKHEKYEQPQSDDSHILVNAGLHGSDGITSLCPATNHNLIRHSKSDEFTASQLSKFHQSVEITRNY